jgi:hypothetical protein
VAALTIGMLSEHLPPRRRPNNAMRYVGQSLGHAKFVLLPGVEDGSFEAAIDSLKLVILYTIERSMLFPLTSDGIVHAPLSLC